MIHALDQEQMKAQSRAQHRAAITIFIQAAGERSKSTDDGHAADQTQVASVFTDDEYELLQIHADYVQILPAESISDCVCAWVDGHPRRWESLRQVVAVVATTGRSF